MKMFLSKFSESAVWRGVCGIAAGQRLTSGLERKRPLYYTQYPYRAATVYRRSTPYYFTIPI